jgi:hypothetical protein
MIFRTIISVHSPSPPHRPPVGFADKPQKRGENKKSLARDQG